MEAEPFGSGTERVKKENLPLIQLDQQQFIAIIKLNLCISYCMWP